MALALFDLDNTLLAGDSEHAWGEFLVEVGAVEERTFRVENERLYAEYLAGTLDIHRSIRHQLGPLMRHPMERLLLWREEFVASRVEPMVTTAALALVEEHRAAGDKLAIITASNSFVTRPIADRFGVENLLAIELECVNGRFTGRVLGVPTFREGKVARLREWMRENGDLEGSYFYSDSHNDLPLLREVEHPVAVDPDPPLRAYAETAGWPIRCLNGVG